MKKIDNFLIEDIKYTLKSFIPDIIQFLDLPYGEQWNREDTEADGIIKMYLFLTESTGLIRNIADCMQEQQTVLPFGKRQNGLQNI